MQNNVIQCFRSKLKTRGYTEIHISKVDVDCYFIECCYDGVPLSAVLTSGQMSAGFPANYQYFPKKL